MSKLTIIEGNNNDKDNVRALMVKGEAGNDGISPTATVSKTGTVATVTITDKNGTTTAAINDGVSPTASVSKTGNTATLTVTDESGTTTADIEDGVSPTVNISKTGGVTTITITDANGTHTATINDGEVTNASLAAALADYKLKGDFAVITGSITIAASSSSTELISYPTGFTADNSVPISCGLKQIDNRGFNYVGTYSDSSDGLNNAFRRRLNLTSSEIKLFIENPDTASSITVQYQIVLMKVS